MALQFSYDVFEGWAKFRVRSCALLDDVDHEEDLWHYFGFHVVDDMGGYALSFILSEELVD